MSTILGIIITAVVCLGIGAAGMFFWNKKKRIQGQEDAEDAIENSIDNDKDREIVKREIEERIKKNEEIRAKLREKLKSAEEKENSGV